MNFWSVDFESVAGHPCLFIRQSTGAHGIIVIAVFVDDLIVHGEKDEDIEHLKKLMNENNYHTDGGNLDYYLGVKLEYPDDINLVMHKKVMLKNFLKKLVWKMLIQ